LIFHGGGHVFVWGSAGKNGGTIKYHPTSASAAAGLHAFCALK
jgi:hypothetical protein